MKTIVGVPALANSWTRASIRCTTLPPFFLDQLKRRAWVSRESVARCRSRYSAACRTLLHRTERVIPCACFGSFRVANVSLETWFKTLCQPKLPRIHPASSLLNLTVSHSFGLRCFVRFLSSIPLHYCILHYHTPVHHMAAKSLWFCPWNPVHFPAAPPTCPLSLLLAPSRCPPSPSARSRDSSSHALRLSGTPASPNSSCLPSDSYRRRVSERQRASRESRAAAKASPSWGMRVTCFEIPEVFSGLRWVSHAGLEGSRSAGLVVSCLSFSIRVRLLQDRWPFAYPAGLLEIRRSASPARRVPNIEHSRSHAVCYRTNDGSTCLFPGGTKQARSQRATPTLRAKHEDSYVLMSLDQ